MAQITGLDYKIREMAARIKELREIEGLTTYEMAAKTLVTRDEYIACESGTGDLNFTFIYRCALALGVDVTDIIEGHSPTLKSFTVTRAGEGQEISNAHGMTYYNLAYAFQNRISEPLYVKSKYDEEAQHKDIELTSHDGQELDLVISGNLMVQVGEHKTILKPGDSIYFSSSTPHGMIAVNGNDCEFYAIVINPTGAPVPELTPVRYTPLAQEPKKTDDKERIWHKYIDVQLNAKGTPEKISFKNTEKFNFAFDLVDAIAERSPEKLAMLHVSKDKTERRITYADMKKESARCANYFKSIGIKKGDKVMLILKRHYQFWFAMIGLNKLGAIAIPATNQLLAHDIEYRFNAAEVSAIICTPDDGVPEQVDIAAKNSPSLKHKIIVNASRDGWRNFDEESKMFSSTFPRTEDSPCGDDLLLMYFTSGTSGYPKIAAHNHKYPLGHFHTAKYWHCVEEEGLHFTISDTGWAKAMWGKLYGQWLAEGATFVYDFDRFHADDIMPMFAKYQITTFCAPPTMLRMMIKEDLSKYDFSSVKHMTTAGEALNPEVYRQFEKLTGLQIHEGFGQSESTMIIGNMCGAGHKVGSMGKPAPIYDVRLVDVDGKPVPAGETGEVVIDISKGLPCGLAVEYYKDPEKTADTWRDGLYHTGDTAWMDEDGFYWYVGRTDDMIKSSGYRIGPFEIESVIMELPYVLECGVSPAPDPVRGQIVKASIVLVKGTEPTEELKKEIQNYVKEHTAPYKYPRLVVFKDELPKTTSGKIIRKML
ncbi:MAG: AMP-binding protein [Sphaerochaetaceae bacterium]|nr:AMP-binding protein [Sphaerochaetaceae bacterium]